MLLAALGVHIRLEASDPAVERWMSRRFSSLSVPENGTSAAVRYRYRTDGGTARLILPDGRAVAVRDACEASQRIEAGIVVELQRLRPDLLFLHSATLAYDGRAILLAARSGVGKSTTAWALLHHGFEYGSDELSPVDISSGRVLPYPRALALKRSTPRPYLPPAAAMRCDGTIYLRAPDLPSRVVGGPRAIAAIFLLERERVARRASIVPIGSAEAATRLYVTALNPLSHPDRGLASVVRIVRAVPCYRLSLATLESTCSTITAALS